MSALEVRGAAALKAHLNSEVAVTEYMEVSQESITQFAALTDDRQWIHVDVERARRESPYGGTVAHGFLTLAFLSHFLNAAVKVEGTKLLVSCGLSSVRFLTPVPAASRIRARVRLREYSEAQGYVQVTWRLTVECEAARAPSCIADWVVRYCE